MSAGNENLNWFMDEFDCGYMKEIWEMNISDARDVMHVLEYVSGHTIAGLITLFRRGYELRPPKQRAGIKSLNPDWKFYEKLSKSATDHLNKILDEREGRIVLR